MEFVVLGFGEAGEISESVISLDSVNMMNMVSFRDWAVFLFPTSSMLIRFLTCSSDSHVPVTCDPGGSASFFHTRDSKLPAAASALVVHRTIFTKTCFTLLSSLLAV